MKPYLFLLLALPLIASRCKGLCGCDIVEPTKNFEMNFKATYNSKPLIINQVVDYNGKKMRITKLSYFLSHIETGNDLLNPQNFNEVFSDAILVDFADTDDSIKAVKGVSQSIGVFLTNIQKLAIGVGVDTLLLNTRKPNNFPTTSPLSDAGHYWEDWNSYIFTKFEGLMDKDGDGRFETGITLHTGGKQVYRRMDFTKKFEVDAANKFTAHFELNVNELLKGIDLETVGSTHQLNNLPTMQKFVNNFQTALVLK